MSRWPGGRGGAGRGGRSAGAAGGGAPWGASPSPWLPRPRPPPMLQRGLSPRPGGGGGPAPGWAQPLWASGREDRGLGGRLLSTTRGSRGRGAGGGRGARGSNNNTDSPPPPPPPPPPDLRDAGLLGGSGGRPSTVARRNLYDTEAGRGRAGVWKLAAMGGPEGQARREAATGPSMPTRVDLGGRARRDVHAIFRGLLLLAVTHCPVSLTGTLKTIAVLTPSSPPSQNSRPANLLHAGRGTRGPARGQRG